MITKVLEPPYNHPDPTKAYTGEEAYYRVDKQLACGNCGTDDFQAFQGSYLTVIKCITCGYEYNVYEG